MNTVLPQEGLEIHTVSSIISTRIFSIRIRIRIRISIRIISIISIISILTYYHAIALGL
jgi:hypothetical protein